MNQELLEKMLKEIEIANALAESIKDSRGLHPSFRGDVDSLKHTIVLLLEKDYKLLEILQILNLSSVEDVFHNAEVSTEKVETKAVDDDQDEHHQLTEAVLEDLEEPVVEKPQAEEPQTGDSKMTDEAEVIVEEEPEELKIDDAEDEDSFDTVEEKISAKSAEDTSVEEHEEVEENEEKTEFDDSFDLKDSAEISLNVDSIEEETNEENPSDEKNCFEEEPHLNAEVKKDEPHHEEVSTVAEDESVDDSTEEAVKDVPEEVEKPSEKSNKTVEYKIPEEGDFNPDDSMIDDGADDLFNLSDDELDNLFNEDFDF